MMYYDKIEIIKNVVVPDEYDEYGNPVTVETRYPIRADVQPLSTTENVVAGQQVVTRYKVILGTGEPIKATDAIYWDGKKYQIEGDVENHKLMGRMHHREMVVSRVTG